MALAEQLFPKKEDSKQAASLQSAAASSGALAAKLKLAEERYANLHKRNKLNEEALLEIDRSVKTELRVLTRQLVELRRHITEMRLKIDGMQGELASVAHKHELVAIERYVDLWQPVHFVSREEAKQLIEDAKRSREGGAQ